MTWTAWRQQPPYDPNSPYGRTFDPNTGNELFVEGSYSDGVTSFRISGENIDVHFTGCLGILSESEEYSLQIEAAIIWDITCLNNLDDSKKQLICDALKKYQLAHGSNPKSDPVFIRFDRGILFNA